MRRACRSVALLVLATIALLPFGVAHAQSGRTNKTVPVWVGNPGDHWASMLGYTFVGTATQDGKYGYKVSFRAADGCEITIFWPRETIDFRGDAPGFRLYKARVRTGWFWYPSRLTAKSLPKVHQWVLYIEADNSRQADAAIAGAQGFALVAGMGTLAPTPRVPIAASHTAVRGASGARTSAALSPVFRRFTRDNFRHNLTKLSGVAPNGSQAHHVLPVKFEGWFSRAGLNIHDPRFGAWWAARAHRQFASAYNAKWLTFLRIQRTADEMLAFARQIAREYGLQIYF